MGAAGPLDNEHESVTGNPKKGKPALVLKTKSKKVDTVGDEIDNPKYLTANAVFI